LPESFKKPFGEYCKGGWLSLNHSPEYGGPGSGSSASQSASLSGSESAAGSRSAALEATRGTRADADVLCPVFDNPEPISYNPTSRPVPGHRSAPLDFLVILQPESDGRWSAWAPDLPGCASMGASEQEARARIREAIEVYLEGLRILGRAWPAARARADSVRVDAA
jgi:predicted RNase H-like HicB family nuclease